MVTPRTEGAPTSAATKAKPPRFASILVARLNNARPTELEVELRKHCGKMRVNQQLSGAHLIIPGESTLAIRAYYPADLNRLERTQQQEKNPSNQEQKKKQILDEMHMSSNDKKRRRETNRQGRQTTDHSDDMDGLRAFQSNFQLSVVFFILPAAGEIRQRQLDDADSFYHRAVRILHEGQPVSGGKDSRPICTKVLVVSDTIQALDILMPYTETIAPTRRQLKQQFYKKEQRKLFVPSTSTNEISSSLARQKQTFQFRKEQQQQPDGDEYDRAAGTHGVAAFRDWVRRFEMPDGEADLLYHYFGGCLGDIVSADASKLGAIPVDRRTKEMLVSFFETDGDDDVGGNSRIKIPEATHHSFVKPTSEGKTPAFSIEMNSGYRTRHTQQVRVNDDASKLLNAPFHDKNSQPMQYPNMQQQQGFVATAGASYGFYEEAGISVPPERPRSTYKYQWPNKQQYHPHARPAAADNCVLPPRFIQAGQPLNSWKNNCPRSSATTRSTPYVDTPPPPAAAAPVSIAATNTMHPCWSNGHGYANQQPPHNRGIKLMAQNAATATWKTRSGFGNDVGNWTYLR